MAPSPELSPPGTSTYSSDKLNAGDGTWDSQRNTFLLPNLMGVNFEMMQYNGMGNRFRNMEGYHPLIRAHGVLAAITFLGIVPAAILIARFSSRNPYWALRLHIWMQIMTLFLTTVIFILGWFAVGPKRSLTNPHHGIGLAIYVLIIVQTFWGWLVHKTLKGKRRPHIPLNLMLHQWTGRGVALLGIIQIPLGLTLYGSPLSLFILYALAVFALFMFFFIMTYIRERRAGADYDSRGTYSTGPEVVDDGHGHGRFGRIAAVGAAGAGLAMLGRKYRGRSKSRSRSPDDRSDRTTRFDEKESRHDKKSGGWGKKIFQLGAAAGAVGLGKKLFDKRRDREDDAESGRYRPAHTATDSLDDESIARHDGRHSGRPPPGPRPYDGAPSTNSEFYTDSEVTRPEERSHKLRNTMLGAGAFALGRKLFGNRAKAKKEEEQRVADETHRMNEANERRRARHRGNRPHSPTSDLTQTDPDVGPSYRPPPGDVLSGSETVTSVGPGHRRHRSSAAAGATGAAIAGASNRRSQSRRRQSGGREGSFDSQPLSIKVRTHNNGRNITLRQLTRDETRADREARRRERARSGRHRRENSLSEGEGDSHWRRVEERERQQAQDMQNDEGDISTIGPSVSAIPPPAPESVPMHGGAPSTSMGLAPPPVMPAAVSSPLASTDLSGSYASRSERRRVERRVARHARQPSVEFT